MATLGLSSRKYVARKISKIRWRPEKNSKLGIPSETFVTGSYDDDNNLLCLWHLSRDNDDRLGSEAKQLNKIQCEGEVTDIKFFNEDSFIASSSLGYVTCYEIQAEGTLTMQEKFKWNDLHYYKERKNNTRCSALDIFNDVLVTVGDDGKLNALSLRNFNNNPIQVIEADSSPIWCVRFVNHNECLTGGMRGQMKMWDMRGPNLKPVNTLFLSKVEEQVGPNGYSETHFPAASCIAQHPSQAHIVISGDEAGDLCVWDMRDTSVPYCVLNSHSSTVWEGMFHPQNPDHFFSCSLNGDLFHWDCTFPRITNPYETSLIPRDQVTWMALGMSKHRPSLRSLMGNLRMSINSLDVSGDSIICGSDNESFYICNKINLATK